MTSKQKNNLGGIALLAFCAGLAVWGISRGKKLKDNHVLGTGQVYRFSSGGKGNAGGVWIDFAMEVKGKKYKGSTRYQDSDFKKGALYCIRGKSFPLVYHPPNPSISDLLLLPRDFKALGLAYPDSLNWLLPYLKKE